MSFKVSMGGTTHTQTTPSDRWVVHHNLGRPVVVDTYVTVDGTLTKILPLDVRILDEQSLEILFTTPRVGEARIA